MQRNSEQVAAKDVEKLLFVHAERMTVVRSSALCFFYITNDVTKCVGHTV